MTEPEILPPSKASSPHKKGTFEAVKAHFGTSRIFAGSLAALVVVLFVIGVALFALQHITVLQGHGESIISTSFILGAFILSVGVALIVFALRWLFREMLKSTSEPSEEGIPSTQVAPLQTEKKGETTPKDKDKSVSSSTAKTKKLSPGWRKFFRTVLQVALVVLVIWLFFGAGLFHFIVFMGHRNWTTAATAQPSAATVPSNSKPDTRIICGHTKTWDYSDKNPAEIRINAREGCYGDQYILPRVWDSFESETPSNVGDHASVWCNGEPNPRSRVEYYTANMGNTLKKPCCDPRVDRSDHFRVQGHGEIVLLRTSQRRFVP
jgi:hypothetical protein